MTDIQVEIERKFIIKKPSVGIMESCPDYSCSEILQIYLSSPVGVTRRIRSRKTDGKTVYTETKKIRIDKMSAYEDEREISESEFSAMRGELREGSAPISKVRHTFTVGGQCFEVDVYPEWKHTCILEAELPSRDARLVLPNFIEPVAEVTGDAAYSNSSMSKSFPKEIVNE